MAKLSDILGTIYVDMDGTLVDTNPTVDKLLKGKGFGKGRPLKDIYGELFEADPNAFANFPWKPGAKQLWNLVKPYNPVILTSVAMYHRRDIIKGKGAWVKKNLGGYKVIYETGKGKPSYANKGDILVDDDTKWKSGWEGKGAYFVHAENTSKAISELKRLLDK
jgi:hypothetical protein